MTDKWPSSTSLTSEFLKALNSMGGTGTVADLDSSIIHNLSLTTEQLAVKRSGNRGEIQYRLAWVRTKAKQNGLVTKEANRVWKITEKGRIAIQ